MRLLLAAMLLSSSLSPLAVTVRAEETAVSRISAGLRQWFAHVKEGLSESSVSGQRQRGRFNAVAAVRGEEQEAADPAAPVWKSAAAGKASKALSKQRRELAAAVDAIMDGRLEEGQKQLDAFEKAHEGSPMLADAREIRSKLAEAQSQTAASAAPAAAAASAQAEDMARAKAPKAPAAAPPAKP